MPDLAEDQSERLRRARVLVELGDLAEAEALIVDILDAEPEHVDALSLLAKVKHIRGELSLAVACAAQVQAHRAARGGVAGAHLESMLRLAQDPERAAGEFVAVGGFRLVQKPAAYLALEQAFQHFVARRPNEARAVCRSTAARYRDRDPEIAKLSVLAEAWISELIGELDTACAILERLGRRRGFETDIDRVTALVRVYERIGTPDKLNAALQVYHYLEEQLDDWTVLGRLALLHRRLGHEAEAARYEARHLAAYRHAMQRPTLADVLQVATTQFLPIERLRRLEAHDGAVPQDLPDRGRAVAAAMRGELDVARSLLPGEEPLDLKYRADIEGLAADGEPGPHVVALYCRALAADPADIGVLGWLLDEHARRPSPAIADLLRAPAVAASAFRALERVVQASPADPRPWRRLATLFTIQPGGEAQAQQMLDRATANEQTTANATRACGRALSAAVYRFFGKAHGLIHEVWATREMASPGRGGALRRDDVLGSVTDEMKDSVRNTFFAVREYALAKFPHHARDLLDYHYFYKVTKEDEPSSGVSAGLPTALAFLSLFLQRPLPQDIAFTGALVTDAHDVLIVRPVGDIEPKIDAAYHRNLRMIVVPAGNRVQLEQSGAVPRDVSAQVVRYAHDLDQAVRLTFGEDAFL